MREEPRELSFRDALEAWAFVAANSFGGPAGQIAVLHRVLVEERRWLSEERFLHALHFCMLLPGPEAQQLVTWSGWVTHGYRGGLVAGWLFVLPGFVSLLGLSAMYGAWHAVPAVEAALLGLKAAVLAVVVEAVLRIGRRVLATPAQGLLALAAFLALFVFQLPFPLVVLSAGLLGLSAPALFPPPPPPPVRPGEGAEPLVDARIRSGLVPWLAPAPRRDLAVAAALVALWGAPTIALWSILGADSTWTRVALFFSQAAVVTFGGAYSVLAWVAQHAVEAQGWLTASEMMDGLGLAETTPGPLIQVVQFVGFLATSRDPGSLDPRVAGALGSALTTWVTFWPSFAFVLAGAPYVERIRQQPALASALRAVTCAVVGVVANLGVWLSVHTLFAEVAERSLGPARLVLPSLGSLDPVAALIAVASGFALLRYKAPMVLVLLVAVVVGLLVFGAGEAARWGGA